MAKVSRALITVYDKSGLAEFAKELAGMGIEIISTGGTAKALAQAGLKVTEVSAMTGFPELFEGRLKTLHPLVHGGILYKRGDKAHEAQAEKNKIKPIDLVVVNLYAFEKEPGIEMIDIGGPALIRAAAKNSDSVAVVIDPSQYAEVLADMKKNKGAVSAELRKRLMLAAYARTSQYDSAIVSHFSSETSNSKQTFPDTLVVRLSKAQDLRYGENPHQGASAYLWGSGPSLANAKQYSGKQLSYNNLLDADSALRLMRDLRNDVATVIIKHNNPCGGGRGKTLLESYKRALSTDPQSAFGSVIAFSRKVDLVTASAIGDQFVEVVLAPGYDEDALAMLASKKSRRLLDITALLTASSQGMGLRSISGGMLYQAADSLNPEDEQLSVATKRKPTDKEKRAMAFGMVFAKHVKSNAIVFSGEEQVLGIGAGQMSRVDACRIAVEKAKDAKLSLKGSAMASDAFFPFRDTVDFAAEAGATSIIQPGGSIRDKEVIAAADEHGIAMLFTGIRHFKH